MRICFVTPEFVTERNFSGGLANYLGRITTALAQRGHEVHVLVRSQEKGEAVHGAVAVHRVVPLWSRNMLLDHVDPLVPRPYYNVYQDLKAAWCLWLAWKRLKKEETFDLVQIANVMGVGLFFNREKCVPVVLRMSSYRPLWDRLAGTADTHPNRLRWGMEKTVACRTRHIYAPTYFVANQLREHYGISGVEVIESPFFPETETQDASLAKEFSDRRPYLLFFGRMTMMKGVHIFAESLAALLPKFPLLHAVFAGGDGKAPGSQDSMRAWLQEKLSGFNERVSFLPPQPHRRLYPLIEGAAAVVIPSLVDNLPNTCLEAMGLGRIVVATTGSCFEQVIEDGMSGILVPPNNASALQAALERVLSFSEGERDAICRAALASMERLHPDQAVPRLIRYYESVLAAS